MDELQPRVFVRTEVGVVVGNDHAARRSNGIELLFILLADFNIDGAQVIFELLHGARPDDRARDARLTRAPGQGQLACRATVLSVTTKIECSSPDGQRQRVVCQANDIQGYPTWEYADGTRAVGVQSLADLSNASGVPIPTTDRPFRKYVDFEVQDLLAVP